MIQKLVWLGEIKAILRKVARDLDDPSVKLVHAQVSIDENDNYKIEIVLKYPEKE